MLRLALQEALQGDLSLESHLGFHADIHKDAAILVPTADAFQISSAALVVNDKRSNTMSKAFFEHEQSSNATIAIFKGADALETDMEIKDFMEADILLCLVFFEQLIDGCGDLGRRCSLAKLGCCSRLSVSEGNGRMTLMAAALAEQGGLHLLDESLRQRLHGVGEDHIQAKEETSESSV